MFTIVKSLNSSLFASQIIRLCSCILISTTISWAADQSWRQVLPHQGNADFTAFSTWLSKQQGSFAVPKNDRDDIIIALVRNGHVPALHAAIEAGYPRRYEQVSYALRNSTDAIATLLLQNNPINAKQRDELFIEAVQRARSQTIAVLIEHGANPAKSSSERSSAHNTPWYRYLSNHRANVALFPKFLAATPNSKAWFRQNPALLIAAFNTDPAVHQALFAHIGYDYSTPDDRNLIHLWTESGVVSRTPRVDDMRDGAAVLAHLVKQKVAIDAADKKGWTPLAMALRRSPDALRLLLDHGANMNALNQQGVTPLLHAFGDRNRLNMDAVAELISAGVDLNARKKMAKTSCI